MCAVLDLTPLREVLIVCGTSAASPLHSQRATLALQETQLPHRITEIDLQAKPEWYDSKINPASKVPVLQVGGTDENSTGVPRIPESGVLLELISDLGEARGTRSLKPKDVIETGEYVLTPSGILQISKSA